MRTVRARAVWTGDVLLNDACVVLDGATVRDVRPAGRGDPAPMDGLLSPGFVNAHGHLEFAWVEGQVGGGAGLAAWVRALGQVQASSAQRQAEGLAAARAMAATGTALCSDVSNRGDTAPWLVEAGLVGVVQHELLGFGTISSRSWR